MQLIYHVEFIKQIALTLFMQKEGGSRLLHSTKPYNPALLQYN